MEGKESKGQTKTHSFSRDNRFCFEKESFLFVIFFDRSTQEVYWLMSRLNRSLPTLEEQRKLRHGVEFYEKQELELELREIVTEICLNPKSSRVKKIDAFVDTLFDFMKGLPSKKVSSKATFSVTCSGLQTLSSSSRTSIPFQAPSESLKLIGGYPLRLSFKKGLIIDVAVPIPSLSPSLPPLFCLSLSLFSLFFLFLSVFFLLVFSPLFLIRIHL